MNEENEKEEGKRAKEVVVIFGGATHIGKSMVKLFAENNKVVFADVDEEEAGKLVEECEKKGKQVEFFKVDVSKEEEVKNFVKKIIDKFGKIDILINNVCGEKSRGKDFDYSLDEWLDRFKIILGGTYLICKYVLPEMQKKEKGVILNIASVSAEVIGDESLNYHVGKSGLVQFTKYIANKFGQYGIRANCISPGFIVKEKHLKRFESKENEKYRKVAFLAHPLRKIGLADDIGRAALFLCSNNAGFITGQNLIIDGGLLSNDPWSLANSLREYFEEEKGKKEGRKEDQKEPTGEAGKEKIKS